MKNSVGCRKDDFYYKTVFSATGCRRSFYNYSGCTKRFCIIIAVAENAIEIIIIIIINQKDLHGQLDKV